MKRILSFIMALSCILVLFASCGTNNSVPNDNSKTTNTSKENGVSTPAATETEDPVSDVTSEHKVYPIRAEIYRENDGYRVQFITDLSYRELFSFHLEEIESEKELCQSVGLEFKTSIEVTWSEDKYQLEDKMEFSTRGWNTTEYTVADVKYWLKTFDNIGKNILLHYGKKKTSVNLMIYETEGIAEAHEKYDGFDPSSIIYCYISEIIDKTTE